VKKGLIENMADLGRSKVELVLRYGSEFFEFIFLFLVGPSFRSEILGLSSGKTNISKTKKDLSDFFLKIM
jgi:hypothetical protein